jgi:two-component system phosphate regulon response regulator PhoB
VKKILIADDQDGMRRLLRTMLAGVPYEILEAGDGNEALEVALRERPALVLLDLRMPGLDGLEVCRRLRAVPALRGTAVVMLTAERGPDVQRRAEEIGADAYLTKPFSPLEVCDLVEELLGAGV